MMMSGVGGEEPVVCRALLKEAMGGDVVYYTWLFSGRKLEGRWEVVDRWPGKTLGD